MLVLLTGLATRWRMGIAQLLPLRTHRMTTLMTDRDERDAFATEDAHHARGGHAPRAG